MADETPQLPTEEELSQLPQRALVAYAVRAARRVQPLCVKAWPNNSDKRTSLAHAVERALNLATDFSRGENVAADELRVAAATADDLNPAYAYGANLAYDAADATNAAYVAANTAASTNAAAAAAAETYVNAGSREMLVSACRRDFERLLERQASKPVEMKRKVSPSERGFLGSLWIDDPPGWYTELKPQLDAILNGKDASGSDQASTLRSQLARREQTIKALTAQQTELQRDLKNLTADRDQLAQQRAAVEKREQRVQSELSATRENLMKAQQEAAEEKRKRETAEFDLREVSGQLDLETRQPVRWYWETLTKPSSLFSGFTLLCLMGIVLSVLFWVGEVRGRQKLEQFLTLQVAHLQADLAEGNDDSGDGGGAGLAGKSDRRTQLQKFRQQLGRLQTLAVSGSDQEQITLGTIRNDVYELLEDTRPPDNDQREIEPQRSSITAAVSVWWQFFLPRYMASDQLLSLVVIMSGTIGAVIAAIRAKRVLSPTDIGFGVAAGFITLLAIRGGKNVLVVSNEDVSFYMNPYSSAFFGLLAGLFTDRAYELLRKFVDKLVKGLEKTFELNPPPSADDDSPKPDQSP
tara:strand:- start:82994 stop:84739 length:1746 start_codon:yes stop_codon:yes gene_type:complete